MYVNATDINISEWNKIKISIYSWRKNLKRIEKSCTSTETSEYNYKNEILKVIV